MPRPFRSRPLDNFPLTRTSSIDEARDALVRFGATPVLTPGPGVTTLDAVMNYYPMTDVHLYYRSYGADVRAAFPETGYVLKIIPLRGTGEIVIGNTRMQLTGGSTAVVSADMDWQLSSSADYEHLMLRIDAQALSRRLTAMTGASVAESVRFEGSQDGATSATRHLIKYVRSLVDTVSAVDAATPLPGWWGRQTEQLLMTMVLCCNRHNYDHLLKEDPLDAAPAEVREAEDYIAANWRQPINLENLAAITGVSVLSLSRSFKKHRGYSPLEFLAQIRSQGGGTPS